MHVTSLPVTHVAIVLGPQMRRNRTFADHAKDPVFGFTYEVVTQSETKRPYRPESGLTCLCNLNHSLVRFQSPFNVWQQNVYTGHNFILSYWRMDAQLEELARRRKRCELLLSLMYLAPRVLRTWYRMQGCVIHLSIMNICREPSWCRPHAGVPCSLVNSLLRQQRNNVHMVVSPCASDRATYNV